MEQAIDNITFERWNRSANDKGWAWSVFDGDQQVGSLWVTGVSRWFCQTVATDVRYGRVVGYDNPTECIRYLVQRAVNFDPACLSVTP